LRLHAATDDFAKTMSKARQFVDANELSRTAKKPAIRSSPNVNYQKIVDAVSDVLDQRDRNRTSMSTWCKMLTVRRPIIGTERRRPDKARQLLVIRRQEVHPAVRRRRRVRFVFRTR